MSSALHVYAIAIDSLRAALSSGDEKLIVRVARELETRSLDDNGGPTAREATQAIFGCREFDAQHGASYAYALEAACAVLGTGLGNTHWSGTHIEWLERVSDTARALGVVETPASLFTPSTPFAALVDGMPLPEDYPMVGVVHESRTTALKDAYGAATLRSRTWQLLKFGVQYRLRKDGDTWAITHAGATCAIESGTAVGKRRRRTIRLDSGSGPSGLDGEFKQRLQAWEEYNRKLIERWEIEGEPPSFDVVPPAVEGASEVRDAIAEVLGWLNVAERKRTGIVTFWT
jgi:hypothetical protein